MITLVCMCESLVATKLGGVPRCNSAGSAGMQQAGGRAGLWSQQTQCLGPSLQLLATVLGQAALRTLSAKSKNREPTGELSMREARSSATTCFSRYSSLDVYTHPYACVRVFVRVHVVCVWVCVCVCMCVGLHACVHGGGFNAFGIIVHAWRYCCSQLEQNQPIACLRNVCMHASAST